MNIHRYETETKKDADKVHLRAQNSGEAVDYVKAAELYERAGDYRMAAICREAADALMKAAK